MQELLYLAHRIPYPPDKGDKIRSFHLLKHLSKNYRIHLGTFIDCEADKQHYDAVKEFCGETCFVAINPGARRLRSLSALLSGEPLTLPYYRNARLQSWVDTLLDGHRVECVLAFSAAMAQYVRRREDLHRVVDFVDVDSDKWRQYASSKRWPLSLLYRRESRRLLEYERQIARSFDAATFVSHAEAELFRRLAPETSAKVTYFNMGVDANYFSPHAAYDCPYPAGTKALVFTGTMDYWANVDAVNWFARTVFPKIQIRSPQAAFYIVGSRPNSTVKQLAALPGVIVTGTVKDVRPFLAHAVLSIAPLRIARGVQSKVLEAMAMEKTVIVSPQALEGISVTPGSELFVAHNEHDFSDRIILLLQSGIDADIGRAARARILRDYTWGNSLMRIDALLQKQRSLYSPESGITKIDGTSPAAGGKAA